MWEGVFTLCLFKPGLYVCQSQHLISGYIIRLVVNLVGYSIFFSIMLMGQISPGNAMVTILMLMRGRDLIVLLGNIGIQLTWINQTGLMYRLKGLMIFSYFCVTTKEKRRITSQLTVPVLSRFLPPFAHSIKGQNTLLSHAPSNEMQSYFYRQLFKRPLEQTKT